MDLKKMVCMASEAVSDCYCGPVKKRQNLRVRIKDLHSDITERSVKGGCKENPG